jgi:hypothetical protein
MTPDGVRAAHSVFLRPAESYAIVFVGAELIHDQDDLQLVERGAWRALTEDRGDRWANQEFAEYRYFLWAQDEPEDSIAAAARATSPFLNSGCMPRPPAWMPSLACGPITRCN